MAPMSDVFDRSSSESAGPMAGGIHAVTCWKGPPSRVAHAARCGSAGEPGGRRSAWAMLAGTGTTLARDELEPRLVAERHHVVDRADHAQARGRCRPTAVAKVPRPAWR